MKSWKENIGKENEKYWNQYVTFQSFAYSVNDIAFVLYQSFPPSPSCCSSCSLRRGLAKGAPGWPSWGRTWVCSSETSRWASDWARCPASPSRRSMWAQRGTFRDRGHTHKHRNTFTHCDNGTSTRTRFYVGAFSSWMDGGNRVFFVCEFHLLFPSITPYICSFLYFSHPDIYSSAGSYTAEELSSHRSNNLSVVHLVGKWRMLR